MKKDRNQQKGKDGPKEQREIRESRPPKPQKAKSDPRQDRAFRKRPLRYFLDEEE